MQIRVEKTVARRVIRGSGLILIAAIVSASLLVNPATAQINSLPVNKCLVGKIKGVGKSLPGRTGCYSKEAASGVANPSCHQKASDKFTGGADASRGVFTKLEEKYPLTSATPCLTFSDQDDFESELASYATEVAGVVGSAGKCDAAKLKCVGKYVGGMAKCHAKAAGTSGAVDSECTAKVAAKLADGIKGCLDKAALKADCTHSGSQAATLKGTADTFIQEALCALAPAAVGCAAPTPTETSTPIPTDTPTEIPTDTPTSVPTETPTEIATSTPTNTLAATATASATATVSLCGNGVIDVGESCDGDALGGATCAGATSGTQTFGSMRCTAACTLTTSCCTLDSRPNLGGSSAIAVDSATQILVVTAPPDDSYWTIEVRSSLNHGDLNPDTVSYMGQPTIYDLSAIIDPATCDQSTLDFGWVVMDGSGNEIYVNGLMGYNSPIIRTAANSVPNGWYSYSLVATRRSDGESMMFDVRAQMGESGVSMPIGTPCAQQTMTTSQCGFLASIRAVPDTILNVAEPNPSSDPTGDFEFTSLRYPYFECRIDGGTFSGCTSPYSTPPLAAGSHTFEVRSNDDPTPESYTWEVTP